mmetsp:Transcript_101644/g.175496  ORF Transcript_101644/g.175496 Transcript_101644/m.175496 type:complete len:210 (-) Transcript_101644:798-1427(-)
MGAEPTPNREESNERSASIPLPSAAESADIEANYAPGGGGPEVYVADEDVANAKKKAAVAAGGAGCCQLCIWIAMGIFWLVVYLKYKDVPCQDPLPMWCLVQCIMSWASLPMACLAHAVKVHGLKKSALNQTSKSLILLSCVGCLLSIFHLVWFILGNVWAWGQNEFQCDWDLLKTVRIYLIVVYAFIGVLCCCACVMACVGSAALKKG